MVGTSLSLVVLPVLVYDLSGSAGLTGLVFASRLVPYLLFGLVAGPVADRANRRHLIIGGNVIEGALAATIPAAALFDALTVLQVMAVAFLSATAFVFSDAAVFGAVPSLVHPSRLAAANGLLATLGSGADIAGPILAGALIATIGAANAISVNAASFAVVAAVQYTLRSDFRRPESPTSTRTIRAQLGTAQSFIRSHRSVLTLILAGFGNSISIGIIFGLIVPWSREVLGYSSDDARLGLLYAAVGVGSMCSGLLFSKVFTTGRVRFLTPVSLGWSTAASALFLVTTGWLAPVAMVIFSFGIMLTITIGITYRQLVTPDDLMSTVNTVGRMIAAGGQPLGAAIGALIATRTSVQTAYSTATAVLAVTAASAFIALWKRQPSNPGKPTDG